MAEPSAEFKPRTQHNYKLGVKLVQNPSFLYRSRCSLKPLIAGGSDTVKVLGELINYTEFTLTIIVGDNPITRTDVLFLQFYCQ
jgi:hypothetical protein